MSVFRGELTKLIARALETFRPPAASIAGQLDGTQVAPAASGSPGVVDPDAFEPALGSPAADGHILSSTVAGARSWVAPGGGTDPTTTEGDLIYRGPVSVTRLGIGTAGQFLGVAAGVPAWATLAASHISDLSEAVQDIVGAAVKAGAANVTVSYNDATGETTINVAIPSASAITAGTLADARLSSNVPLLNAANVFTAAQRMGTPSDATGAIIQTWYGNTTQRSFLNDQGAQVWNLHSGAAEVGSIGYATPAGVPGILFRDSAGASRSEMRHVAGGGLLFAAGATAAIPAEAMQIRPTGELILAKFLQMAEITAPAAPAANGLRIYAEDNGAGKTRLMARFATGAAVQIAIQP